MQQHLSHFRLPRPKELGGLMADCAREWTRHRASSKGAALALYMVFSLAPMLILVIAVAGFFFGEAAVRSQLFSQMQDLMGQRGADVIQSVLASAHESNSGWIAALLSISVLLFSATTAFTELKASLDELWEVKHNARSALRGMVQSRMASFGLVLVLALFLLLSLALNGALAAAQRYYGGVWNHATLAMAASWVSNICSFALVTSLFAVVFKLLPSLQIDWLDVIPGSIVTAALFLVGKWAIGLYLSHGGTVSAYGAAGSLIALLLWIYYSAQIFFFGAVFTRQFALRFSRPFRAKHAAHEPEQHTA